MSDSLVLTLCPFHNLLAYCDPCQAHFRAVPDPTCRPHLSSLQAECSG